MMTRKPESEEILIRYFSQNLWITHGSNSTTDKCGSQKRRGAEFKYTFLKLEIARKT